MLRTSPQLPRTSTHCTHHPPNYIDRAASHLRPGLWGLLEWHNHIIYFPAAADAPPPLQNPARLSQFLGGLGLLLGHLLLWHDGHPWGYRSGDGLLGDVVVVDEGEEAPTAPGTLRGVAAIKARRHTATLLLQKRFKKKKWKFGFLFPRNSKYLCINYGGPEVQITQCKNVIKITMTI